MDASSPASSTEPASRRTALPAVDAAALHVRPAPGLRHPFTQSLLASLRLRKGINERRWPHLNRLARTHILDAGDGVQLQALHTPALQERRGTVVLLHGWEGCHDSIYLHSLGCHLHRAGWEIVRLNLRDHGATHHLNAEPFHSARMDEVFGALRAIARLVDNGMQLVGFSLGGNFTLRSALGATAADIPLRQAIAINPAVNPRATTEALDGQRLYSRYFTRKWRRTLAARRAAWPLGPDYADLLEPRQLLDVTERFATRYLGFSSADDYFSHYWLRPGHFRALDIPTTIVSAADDALVPVADIAALQGQSPQLEVCVSPHGGHCGYVRNWRLQSWLDPWVAARLNRFADSA